MITTTLRRIRAANPCKDGWEKLLRHIGKLAEDDEPVRFSTIVESNGINDAIWCMRTLDDLRLIGTIAGKFALRVADIYEAKHPNDDRVRYAAELTASGVGTPEELLAVADAAAYAAAHAATAAAHAADALADDDAAALAAAAAALAAGAAAYASDDADAERAAQAQIMKEILG